jgi:nucleotide-binding universal stress UspA family protein
MYPSGDEEDPMAVRTLVFGDDGSPAADVAWLQINCHAWPGWRVEVVSVETPLLTTDYVDLHEWNPAEPRTVFSEAEFVQVAHLTAKGDPRLVLSRACDLLVIGPRGPGLLKALHLGSTADWLLTRPPAPILIARHGRPITSALLCVDGSVHANRATGVLCALPWVDRLRVTVLAVDDERVDINAATQNAAEQLEAVGADVNIRVHSGKPTPEIKDAVDRLSPDLVALGTRGLTGLHHLRVGSTASAIARTATCSVLVACESDEL